MTTGPLPEFLATLDGQIIIAWPDGKPQWIRMDVEVLEDIIEQINELRRIEAGP